MDGFGLLLGHLLGDYVLQNDWQAANKVSPRPGKKPPWPWRFGPAPRPTWTADANPADPKAFARALEERNTAMAVADLADRETEEKLAAYNRALALWKTRQAACRLGHLACTTHCLLYTLAVWACSWSWVPWWGLLVCFLAHWPVDRFRLARWWMDHVSGQQAFAEKMGPWSVIAVDNTFHLLTLYLIALATGRP
jgi:hypothetical protein